MPVAGRGPGRFCPKNKNVFPANLAYSCTSGRYGIRTLPANATLVLSDLVFRDLGGTGFGVAPRLLTLQNQRPSRRVERWLGPEGQPYSPASDVSLEAQSNVFSVGALGWTSGAAVGIGLDTNEIGSTKASRSTRWC